MSTTPSAKNPSPPADGAGAARASTNYPAVAPTLVLQPRSRLGKLFTWMGWIGFAVTGLMLFGFVGRFQDYFDTSGGITESYVSGDKYAVDKIAVLSVEGVIMQGDGFVKHQIDRIAEDQHVKAIVLRVDSPGGTVTGSDYIYHHLVELKKKRKIPIVVSMGSMAASGGYYVAMAVGDEKDSIFAEPTTSTGSIGVILPHYDLSGLLAKFDAKEDSIATHPRKQMLSMTKPMTDENRQILKAHIDEMFSRFKEIVKAGRPVFKMDAAALDQLATGEIFGAQQALKHGLVDKIGFVEEAIDRAATLATLDLEKTRVVRYSRPADLFGFVGSAEAKQAHGEIASLRSLLEMSAPKAYYLFAPLPTVGAYPKAD